MSRVSTAKVETTPGSADLRKIAVTNYLTEMQLLAEEIYIMFRPAVVDHEGPQRLDSRHPAGVAAVNKGLVPRYLRIDLVRKQVQVLQQTGSGEEFTLSPFDENLAGNEQL